MLDLLELLLHPVGVGWNRPLGQLQVVVGVALRRCESLVRALQAERIGAQDRVLPPAAAFLGLLDQRQVVEQQKQLLSLGGRHLPQAGRRLGVEAGLLRKGSQAAQASLALCAVPPVLAQIVIGILERNLHIGLLVGPVQVRQVAEAHAASYPVQQLVGRCGVAVGFAQVQRRAGQSESLRVAAQLLRHAVSQLVGQAGRATLQQSAGVGLAQHVQLLDGLRPAQRVGYAAVTGGDQDCAGRRRHGPQRGGCLVAPHVVEDQQQATVVAQQHLHRVGCKDDLVQPGHAQVAVVGVSRQALQQRRDVGRRLVAPTHLRADRDPNDAAGILVGVARGVHGGQHGFAHAGQTAHAHQGHIAPLQAPVQFVQLNCAADCAGGEIGSRLLRLAPGQRQLAHIVDVEHLSVVANGAVDGRNHGVLHAPLTGQGLPLQPVVTFVLRLSLPRLPVSLAQRPAHLRQPDLVPQRDPRLHALDHLGIALLAGNLHKLLQQATRVGGEQHSAAAVQNAAGRIVALRADKLGDGL